MVLPSYVVIDLSVEGTKKCFLCRRSLDWMESSLDSSNLSCCEKRSGEGDEGLCGGGYDEGRVVCCADGQTWWHKWCYGIWSGEFGGR